MGRSLGKQSGGELSPEFGLVAACSRVCLACGVLCDLFGRLAFLKTFLECNFVNRALDRVYNPSDLNL
jgi:hypothetical protein